METITLYLDVISFNFRVLILLWHCRVAVVFPLIGIYSIDTWTQTKQNFCDILTCICFTFTCPLIQFQVVIHIFLISFPYPGLLLMLHRSLHVVNFPKTSHISLEADLRFLNNLIQNFPKIHQITSWNIVTYDTSEKYLLHIGKSSRVK